VLHTLLSTLHTTSRILRVEQRLRGLRAAGRPYNPREDPGAANCGARARYPLHTDECVHRLSSPGELARPDCEPPLRPLAKSPLHVSIFISHRSDHKRRTCRRRPSSQYHMRRGNARASDGVRGAAALAAAAVTVVATAAQTLRPRAPWSLGLSSWLVRMPSSLVRRLNSDKSSRSRYSSSLRRRVTIAVSPRSDE